MQTKNSCLTGMLTVLLTAGSFTLCAASQPEATAGSKVQINQDMVLVIDGKKVFPIGFTMPPPPDAQAPSGRNAIAELADAGATFLRTGVMGEAWSDAAIEKEQAWQDAAARQGLHCWVFLRELGSIESGAVNKEAMLRKVVQRFRHHPGLGVWKGADEPEWGKLPVPGLIRAREIIRELDPNHPLALTHAPRGTVDTLRPYNAAADITGADIYPVGYPPGTHSLGSNKQISMVGDYAQTMMKVAGDKMPVWMILQIAWSGVIKPGKTLRFPTFAEERFMAYQSIINGARGLIFFGGHIEKAWAAEDVPYRWNWTFWRGVLGPVVQEIGVKSPLYPALVAPNSKLPIAAQPTTGLEFCGRETDDALFILACKREGETIEAKFSNLPPWAKEADVLFESPRKVVSTNGLFKDWFGPFEVHVYRFKRSEPSTRNPNP